MILKILSMTVISFMNRCLLINVICRFEGNALTMEYRIGQKCNVTSDCHYLDEFCEAGRCQCTRLTHLYYEDTRPTCKRSVNAIFDQCKTPCPEAIQYCNDYGFCVCRDSTKILVNGVCMTAKFKGPLEECYISNETRTAFLCNTQNEIFCYNGTCICLRGLYKERGTTNCIPQTVYLERYQINEYKALVEDYCFDEQDCIDGLTCDDYTCQCPSGCVFLNETLTCDCGVVMLYTPDKVVTTSGLLGILSCGFWTCLIGRMIFKHKKSERRRNANRIPAEAWSRQSTDSPPHYKDCVTPAIPAVEIEPSAPPEPPHDNPPNYENIK